MTLVLSQSKLHLVASLPMDDVVIEVTLVPVTLHVMVRPSWLLSVLVGCLVLRDHRRVNVLQRHIV